MMGYLMPVESSTEDACGTCMKYTLFFTNIALLIGSISVFSVGFHMFHDKSYSVTVFDVNVVYIYNEAIALYIVIGLLCGSIAFFGCWGSINEVRFCLLMHAVMISTIFIITLTGVVFIYIHRDRAYAFLQGRLLDEIKRFWEDKFIAEKWDKLQLTWKCCAVKNHVDDWPNKVPDSCCGNRVIFTCFRNSPYLYTTSCLTVFFERLGNWFYVGLYLGVFLMLLLILQMVFGCTLANKLS